MEASAIAHALRQRGCANVPVRTIGISAAHLPVPLPAAGCIILAGLAGALDPSLRVGDVIIDEESDGPIGHLPLRRGPVCTAAAIAATPAEKAALFARTAALAIDMENAIVRQAAREAGVPFIGLRAISDAAADAVDPAALRLVDARGRPRFWPVVMTLLRRPALMPHLVKLRRQSTLAAQRLAEAVCDLIN